MTSTIEFITKMWRMAKSYKRWFALSYLILLLELIITQILPVALGKLTNAAVIELNVTRFLYYAMMYVLFFAGQQICSFTQLIYWQRLNNEYVYGLHKKCYEKILASKAQDLCNTQTGDYINVINTDTMEFHHIIQKYAMRTMNSVFGMIISLIIICYIKVEIALILVVIIPFSVLLTTAIMKRIKSANEDIRSKNGEYKAWLMEVLYGYVDIKINTAEMIVERDFNKKSININSIKYHRLLLEKKSYFLIESIQLLAILAFYSLSSYYVFNNSIDIAQFITISAYYTSITTNFRGLLIRNTELQGRIVSIQRVLNLLERENEDSYPTKKLLVYEGKIVFDNVSFSYNTDLPVLFNISFTINPGDKIGIVGASGEGKSTIALLIANFYSPNSGKVYIDGQDLCECSCSSIRESIGIVFQDPIIFSKSIKWNICFDDKNVSDDTIWKLLSFVNLSTDVLNMPEKIYTLLGQDGINLSSGQKKRLAIARMLYSNPPIIIWDEPTNSLDDISAQTVQQTIDDLASGRTTIIISHQLSNILDVDRILVLKDGKQIAFDSLDNLLRKCNYFKELFAEQIESTASICDII